MNWLTKSQTVTILVFNLLSVAGWGSVAVGGLPLPPRKGLLNDLDYDPHELNNLAADPAYQDEIREMHDRMDHWRTRLDDPHPLQSQNPEPKQPRYDNSKRVLDIWQPKWAGDKYSGRRNKSIMGRAPRGMVREHELTHSCLGN